jgi:hypothetical protein
LTAEETEAPARRAVGVKLLIGLQLFVVVDYLLTAVGPYLLYYGIPGKPLGGPHDDVWLIDALSTGGSANPLLWIFGVPGYFITVLGGPIAALLALSGAATAASNWDDLPSRTRGWLLAGIALCVAFFFFGLTPLGKDLAIWVAD